MTSEPRELVLLSQARTALAEVRSLDECLQIADKSRGFLTLDSLLTYCATHGDLPKRPDANQRRMF